MTHTETLDVEFSREFAGELATFIQAVLGKELPMELRDHQIVLRPDDDRVIYVDIRAMILSGVVRKRRPARRTVRRGQLRLVKS